MGSRDPKIPSPSDCVGIEIMNKILELYPMPAPTENLEAEYYANENIGIPKRLG